MDVLSALYIAANVMASVSYIPQIMTLLKDKTRSESVAMASWILWLSASAISLTYFVVRVQDHIVIFASSVNFTGCLIVLSLLAFNRVLKADGICLYEIIKKPVVQKEPTS
ncbi:MAG: hypothetical protein EA357_10365 [Micavibrio sp.]|nr:MAG: hypothetical protein EA357_10365 [Micavibrio sp.]